MSMTDDQRRLYFRYWKQACAVAEWDDNRETRQLMHAKVLKREDRLSASDLSNDETTRVMVYLKGVIAGTLDAHLTAVRHEQDPDLAKREQMFHSIRQMALAIAELSPQLDAARRRGESSSAMAEMRAESALSYIKAIKTATQLTDYVLNCIRCDHFPDDFKGFAQQRRTITQAIAYPANWLKGKGVALPMKRYLAIMDGLMRGIKRHSTGKIKFFSMYFLHVVQKHMEKHGDTYYEEGKSLRNAIETALLSLEEKERQNVEVPETEMDRLAFAYSLLSVKGAGRKKKNARTPRAPRAPKQLGLDLGGAE